jgi:hypothetical protein
MASASTLLEEDLPHDRDHGDVFTNPLYLADDHLARMTVAAVMFGYRHDVSPGSAPSFPGPNPISMDLEHLELVKFNDYVCSPKVDGTRFQLVIVDGRVSIADRTLKVLQPSFASLPETWFLQSSVNPFATILDAEMVNDSLLIFDVVMIAGFRTMDTQMDYRARMQLLGDAKALDLGTIEFGTQEINVRAKPIFEKERAFDLIVSGTPELRGVPLDGLVFTPVAQPVKTFTHWHMFKVKSHHTIDLRLVCVPRRAMVPHPSQQLASSLPEAIAKKINPVIVKNTVTSIHMRKKNTLVSMVGIREKPREVAVPVGMVVEDGSESSSSVQWVTRLEFSHAGHSIDACTKGIEYGGRKFTLKIKRDETFDTLLGMIEQEWRRVEGDVVCMSLIVECQLDVEELAGSNSVNNVTVTRTRPDKTEPNTFNTITRTMTSILYGVRHAHLKSCSAST